MSHLIIENIDTVYTPEGEKWEKTWHNLQTAVSGGIALDGANVPDVFCPMVECGMKPDFDSPVSNVPEDLKEEMETTDWKMILADCRKGKSKSVFPVHVPRKGYKIHQNRELFDCMTKSAEEVLGDGNFEIVSIGTLGGYSQFFMSIVIKGKESFSVGKLATGADDVWDRFFGVNSSHNGLIASYRSLSGIRQVCMNTVKFSIAQATEQDTIASIRHTKNSGELLTPQVFAGDLKKWIAAGETFKATLERMKGESMTLDGFRSFAAGVFTNDNSDKLSTTSFNRITDLESLFSKGQGNVGQTVYDGLNAFTEYFTHGRGTGNVATVKANKRLATANFGRGNDWKLEALRIASDETELAQTVKRGERYFTDYLTVKTAGN